MLGVAQIAFNWTLFMRALDNTRPMAVAGLIGVVVFLTVTMPLMLIMDNVLTGYLIGMSVNTAVQLLFRGYYMQRLFEGFHFWAHALRGLAPSVPAVLAVYAMRELESGRSFGIAVAELAVYWVVTIAATLVFERDLLSEVAGYLRGRSRLPGGAQPAVAAAAA